VERTYVKVPGTFRILLIGDSFIEAYQVDLEESFPRILETKLNSDRSAGDPVFEVVKAGYRAWGTDQAWQFYSCEGYRYQADLVVYVFTVNDVMDNSLPLKARMANWDPTAPPKPYYTLNDDGGLVAHNHPYPPTPPEVQPKSLREYLYKYLVSFRVAEGGWRSLELRLKEQQALVPSTEVNRYSRHVIHYTLPAYLDPPPPEYDEAWWLTEALVKEFDADVRRYRSEFAVVSNGMPWTVEPAMQRELVFEDPFFDGWELDWEYPDRRMSQVAADLGAPFLSLTPGFTDAADTLRKGESYFFREGHYNEAGHRLAAELLYAWLLETGVLRETVGAAE
jgi:hypothetical protein